MRARVGPVAIVELGLPAITLTTTLMRWRVTPPVLDSSPTRRFTDVG